MTEGIDGTGDHAVALWAAEHGYLKKKETLEQKLARHPNGPAIRGDLLQGTTDSHSPATLVAFLTDVHGIKVSPSALERWLKDHAK